MSERSYPFVDGETTDAEFSAMFRQVFPASVIDGLEVLADSSGLNVKLPAGHAYVRGHFYKNTAAKTLTIDAGTSNPRIDTVVLHLEYGTTNSVAAIVKKGAPAASPQPPELTQTDTGVYEFPLADVRVKANAVTIAAADVTWRGLPYTTALKQYLGLMTFAASVVTSGVFDRARIPALPASRIDSGMFGTSLIPHMTDSTDVVYLASAEGGLPSDSAYIGVGAAEPTYAFWVNVKGSLAFQVGNDGTIVVGKIDWSQVTGKQPFSRIESSGGFLVIASSGAISHYVGSNRVFGISPTGVMDAGSVPTSRLSGFFAQRSAPSSSGRSTGDVWVSW